MWANRLAIRLVPAQLAERFVSLVLPVSVDCLEAEGYAREELVAELGAAFLCADLGLALEPRETMRPISRRGSRRRRATSGSYSSPPPTPSAPPISCMACSPKRAIWPT